MSICLVCNRQTYTGFTHERCRGRYVIDGAFSGIVYGKIAKKLIYRFKYKPYLHSLGSFLVELLYESIIQSEAFVAVEKSNAVLVPIPLHCSKYRQRGYNQAEILAAGLGKKLRLSVSDLLVRVRATKSQFSLDRSERRENIIGAFAFKEGERETLRGETVFLVDDVLTSGATLLEAAKVLKKAGVEKVYGLTLAHGQ